MDKDAIIGWIIENASVDKGRIRCHRPPEPVRQHLQDHREKVVQQLTRRGQISLPKTTPPCGHHFIYYGPDGVPRCRDCKPPQDGVWPVREYRWVEDRWLEGDDDSFWSRHEFNIQSVSIEDQKSIQSGPGQKCAWCHRLECTDQCLELMGQVDQPIPFGKYKGKPFIQVPIKYLRQIYRGGYYPPEAKHSIEASIMLQTRAEEAAKARKNSTGQVA